MDNLVRLGTLERKDCKSGMACKGVMSGKNVHHRVEGNCIGCDVPKQREVESWRSLLVSNNYPLSCGEKEKILCLTCGKELTTEYSSCKCGWVFDRNSMENFTVVDFDGWNVGLKESFNQTFLCFESYADAQAIAIAWDDFINAGLWQETLMLQSIYSFFIRCKKCGASVEAVGILVCCPECGAVDWQ